MVEMIQAILTGLFTGIGVGLANYVHEKHIKDRLDKITETLKRTKAFVLNEKAKAFVLNEKVWEEQKNEGERIN